PVNASIQREILPKEKLVQTKQLLQCKSDRSIQSLDNIESRLNSSKGGGSPLSADIRGFMEPRLKTNLKNVRVHTNSEAVQMSRELSAEAFTHGSDIYYGSGKSPRNDHLTAHELTHVMQQTGAVQRQYNLQKTSLIQLTKTKAKKSKPLVNPLVKDIQQKLKRIDTANPGLHIIFLNGLKVDGIYDFYTKQAIVGFQRMSEELTGIPLEDDGELNLLTRQTIDKASSNLKARSLLVKDIQQKLKQLNFLDTSDVEVNGIFDSETGDALRKFQRMSEALTGIPLEANSGNLLNQQAIDKAISNLKASSLLVKDIQQKLKQLNFVDTSDLEVNGIFDSETKEALETFQEISENFTGIPLKVGGQLNKLTLEALDKAINPEAAPLKANELILTTDPKFTNDDFLEEYQDQINQVLKRWSISNYLPVVQLKPILFGSEKKQAIILKWNASWGEKPITSTDHYENLNPIEAKVSVGWLHKLSGWSKLDSNEQTILENMLGSETSPSSQEVRNTLINIQRVQGSIKGRPDTDQVVMLRLFINEKDYINKIAEESIDIKGGNMAAAPLKADELILTTDPKHTNEHKYLDLYQKEVHQALKDWGQFYTVPPIFQKPILFGSQEKQAIILKWNPSWGSKPVLTDFSGSMEPLRAKVSVTTLHKLAGWSKLDSSEQTILDNMLGGETNLLSKKARDVLLFEGKSGKWLHFGLSNTEQQVEKLREFITGKNAIPGNVNDPMTNSKVGYSLGGPQEAKDYPFQTKKADADMWRLDFDDNQAKSNYSGIAIFAPKVPEQGYHNHKVQEIAETVSYLPKANRSLILAITLQPLPNADDPYWATKYKIPNFRSSMTAGASGEVDVYPDKTNNSLENEESQKNSLIHETGHIWSKQNWGNDKSKGKWLEWQKMMDADKVSVSGYAMASISEDFSETFAAYVGTKNSPAFDEYRQIVPNRFAMLEKEYK
ncbi:DUF4157 domain-containing protein, partial [Nostoc sp. NMS4]|uniref:eCIS core domain-containing protein n=1 Tax=Nostoc sp. NMS4 TaxID=2815390 RepID=UPI0025E2F0E1